MALCLMGAASAGALLGCDYDDEVSSSEDAGDLALGNSGFIAPVPNGGVVLNDNERHFGACRSDSGGSNSDCSRKHVGVDIHGKFGTPVVAVKAGVVATRSTNSGAGLFLNVQHSNGEVTRYLHLDRAYVSQGATVARGQRIGDIGDSGRAGSGPHLHFELLRSGKRVDPAALIGWYGLPRVNTAPTGRFGGVPEGGGGDGFQRATLNPGDSGTDVYRLQHLLEAWRPGIMGGSLGGISTASFGPQTLEAVHEAARELRGHSNPSSDYTVGALFRQAVKNAIESRFSGSRRIRYQDAGPDVYRLQHALEVWRPGILAGELGGIETASYGPRTRNAVHAAARDLRGQDAPSDTYVVGPLFWAALLAAM